MRREMEGEEVAGPRAGGVVEAGGEPEEDDIGTSV